MYTYIRQICINKNIIHKFIDETFFYKIHFLLNECFFLLLLVNLAASEYQFLRIIKIFLKM